jgi:hypothetical protein
VIVDRVRVSDEVALVAGQRVLVQVFKGHLAVALDEGQDLAAHLVRAEAAVLRLTRSRLELGVEVAQLFL